MNPIISVRNEWLIASGSPRLNLTSPSTLSLSHSHTPYHRTAFQGSLRIKKLGFSIESDHPTAFYYNTGLNRPVIAEIDDRHCSMDQSSLHSTSSLEQDEWDTEGFVIPSFGIESPDHSSSEALKVEDTKNPPVKDTLDHIYLGPHGAPPQPKQEPTTRKQRFKQKLKEADKKTSSSGRENKVETLRELIGGSGKTKAKMTRDSAKEWLDPHCDESLFDRLNTQ